MGVKVAAKQPLESEIIVERLASFVQRLIFANSWWSDLYVDMVS
jgi:hypothetical protein